MQNVLSMEVFKRVYQKFSGKNRASRAGNDRRTVADTCPPARAGTSDAECGRKKNDSKREYFRTN